MQKPFRVGKPFEKPPAYWLKKYDEAMKRIAELLEEPPKDMADAEKRMMFAQAIAEDVWVEYHSFY